MLVVILGAGASYDSNLDALEQATWVGATRPPLAFELFAMDRDVHRQAARAFPRAAPALQDARADVRAGLSIEAALQRLQDESDDDVDVRAQLLSLRYYLQRVLTTTPRLWDDATQGQTSYVSLLSQLSRWARQVQETLCLITFNYDDLLEKAVERVFGHRIDGFEKYTSHERFRLYKPHGSITWSYTIPWPDTVSHSTSQPVHDHLRNSIIQADPAVEGALAWREPTSQPIINNIAGSPSAATAHVPALAIPVEKKPGLILPPGQEESMRADLHQASAVLAIGWRAREQHVIDLLAEELPPRLQLHSVAETRNAALETARNLWTTSKFYRHAEYVQGFAHFARPEPSSLPQDADLRLEALDALGPLLRQQVPISSVDPSYDDMLHRPYNPDSARQPYQRFSPPQVMDA